MHPEQDPVRVELRAVEKENEALKARVETLSERVDVLAAALQARPRESSRPSPDSGSPALSQQAPDGLASARAPLPPESMIPPDLAVVKVAPPPEVSPSARAPSVRPSGRASRAVPPVPTAVPIQEPDAVRLDTLARPGHRPLATEAEEELRQARALTGLSRAHALEDFAARYPRHSAADDALVEAAAAYGAAGREEAACAIAHRVVGEYPAGEALSTALERVAACDDSRGALDAEQRTLNRIRTDFPGSPAAQRAGIRLTQLTGRGGDPEPHEAPARSGP